MIPYGIIASRPVAVVTDDLLWDGTNTLWDGVDNVVPISILLPFEKRSLAALQASPKKVFAHWHFFPISVDNLDPTIDYWATQWLNPAGEGGAHQSTGGFVRDRPLGRAPLPGDFDQTDCENDIRAATAIGVDGFMYNISVTNPADPSGVWTRFISMLDAADALLGSGFRIIPNIDASAVPQASRAAMVTLLSGIIARPCIYQIGGQPVVSAFSAESWDTANWQAVITGLNCKLVQIFVAFGTSTTPAATYAAGIWGARTAPDINSNANATTTKTAGRLWIEPICQQDYRQNSSQYWEARGSSLLRAMVAEAADTSADWIQLVTWNDFAENSVWEPSTAGQYVSYDLAAYYIEQFKIATPTIVRDVLYYFHRIEPTTVTYNTTAQPIPTSRLGTEPASNRIECLAFLTAPGTIEIEVLGITTSSGLLSAGVQPFEIALGTSGTPIFRLVRSAVTVLTVISAFTIRNSVTYQDFVYRSGSSSRAVVPLVSNPP